MKLYKHFDFSNEKSLDLSLWNIEVGKKWANNELQHYVDSDENLYFDNGLVINATLKNGIYESTRINTKNKFFFKYGRIDVVAKVPKGIGTWPAIWMLSEENKYGRWPNSGEIDIMEHVGRDIDNLFLCLHTESHNHRYDTQYSKEYYSKGISDDFQTYSIDWVEDSITYYVNNKLIVKYERGKDGFDSSHKGWPFNENFFLILNLAIGGKFGGEVNDSDFPQQFIIKDIKIFR